MNNVQDNLLLSPELLPNSVLSCQFSVFLKDSFIFSILQPALALLPGSLTFPNRRSATLQAGFSKFETQNCHLCRQSSLTSFDVHQKKARKVGEQFLRLKEHLPFRNFIEIISMKSELEGVLVCFLAFWFFLQKKNCQ